MKKKKGYGILMFVAILSTLAAISTVIPVNTVEKACMCGYHAHCSFTPISTIICLAIAGFACIYRKKYYTESK